MNSSTALTTAWDRYSPQGDDPGNLAALAKGFDVSAIDAMVAN